MYLRPSFNSELLTHLTVNRTRAHTHTSWFFYINRSKNGGLILKCLLGLNTQSLANNVTFEGYGNFRRLSSAGENTPIWVGPEVLQIDVISYLNSAS